MEDTLSTLAINLGSDTPWLTLVVLVFMFLKSLNLQEVFMLWVEHKAAASAKLDMEAMVEKRVYDSVAAASTLLTSAPVKLATGQPSVSPTETDVSYGAGAGGLPGRANAQTRNESGR